MLLSRPRGRAGADDAGIALLSVLAAMALITTLLTVSLFLVLNNAGSARTSQDARAAYAAAQAGVDEYISRLNSTGGNYWTRGNTDPGNPALTAAGVGRQIQGTGTSGARFRYQLLNPDDVARTGKIKLQVTGISAPAQNGTAAANKTITKTLTATLVPVGFVRYVYFSDVEVVDPALMPSSIEYVTVNGSNGPSGSRRYAMPVSEACGLYYYRGRGGSFTLSGPSPAVGIWNTSTNSWQNAPGSITSGVVSGISCYEIQWASGDVVNGALHSNDALQVNGSVNFADPKTESSWPYCQSNPTADCWWGSGTPSNNVPRYAAPLALPVSNQSVKTIAQDNVKAVGCYYTGPTRITFNGTTMTVLSPNTTSAPARCLNTANRANPQTISIPQVIYVDQVSGSCTGVGYPKSGEWTGGDTTDYSCNRGTAFVQGQVTGQVTVATLDDIVVTGDLTYTNGTNGTDIAGLLAGNYVWVYHPVNAYGNNLPGSTPVYQIQAAILALRHSFLVQNWRYGVPLSTGSDATRLNVLGSLAQKFRGPVGTGNSSGIVSGYLKNYVYDARLLTLQPPYFLQPDNSPWSVQTLTDK